MNRPRRFAGYYCPTDADDNFVGSAKKLQRDEKSRTIVIYNPTKQFDWNRFNTFNSHCSISGHCSESVFFFFPPVKSSLPS